MTRRAGFVRSRQGATALTYGLVVGLVSLVALGSVTRIGGGIEALFTPVADEIAGGSQAAAPAGPSCPAGQVLDNGQCLIPCALTITGSSTAGIVLRDLVSACAGGGPWQITLTIASGVTLGAPNTATPALSLSGAPAGSVVILENAGTLSGAGGAGGRGGQTDTRSSSWGPAAGGDGGPALSVSLTTRLSNTGTIAGGGGGGGGGYQSDLCNTLAGGSGGGGGAGTIAGVGGSHGNGFSGAQYVDGYNGSGGAASSGGAGGAARADTGRLSCYCGTHAVGGAGGAGGALGQPGLAGPDGARYCSGSSLRTRGGAAGGAAGPAIIGADQVTVLEEGTLLGPQVP